MRHVTQGFRNISDQEFRDVKDRICLFKELIQLLENKLDKQQCVLILEAVLEGNRDLAKANAKGNEAIGEGGGTTLNFLPSGVKALLAGKDELFQRATDAARRVTDSQFLTFLEEDLKRFSEYGDKLKPLVDKAQKRSFAYLKDGVIRTAKQLTPAMYRTHEEACKKDIALQSAKGQEEVLGKLRASLIKDVNNLSAQTSYSCVSSPFLIAGG